MASRSPDVPAPLRSAANRRAIPRRPPRPGTAVYDAAEAGVLTVGNTRKGSRGRQAADNVVSRRRLAAHPDLSARQALGHTAPGDVPPTITAIVRTSTGTTEHRLDQTVTRRDAIRAGRYENLTRQLAEGRITGQEFIRRVSRWRPLSTGERFESDPQRVLATIEVARAGGVELFQYRSGRRGAPR